MPNISLDANFKNITVLVDDLVKTFSPGTSKCVTPERAREDLLREGKFWTNQVEMNFYKLANLLVDTVRWMDKIFMKIEHLCKDPAREHWMLILGMLRMMIQLMKLLIYSFTRSKCSSGVQTFSKDPSSSKKLGSSSVLSKNLLANVFPYFFHR